MPSKIKFDMCDIDSWNNEHALVWHLSNNLCQGHLSLFLGSGISQPFLGLSWKELVAKLFASKHEKMPDCSLEDAATRFRYNYFANDTLGYLNAVGGALYSNSNLSFEILRRNDTLGAIGAFAMASLRGNARGIVTLNFDDVLELYLRYHGFVTRSVAEDIHWSGLADITIYHPHGFLPSSLNSSSYSSDIVFDKNSYGRALGGSGSKWREIIFSILRTNTCLFLGLSGADLQLTAWLADAVKDHPAIRANNLPYWGVAFSTDAGSGVKASWKDLGIFCMHVNDYHKHLPNFLFSVCQQAALSKL